MNRPFVRVRDSDVHHIWICNTRTCNRFQDPVPVTPDWYTATAGDTSTPVCAWCGDDLAYSHTEVSQ